MQWRSHNNTVDVAGRFEVQMMDDKLSPTGSLVDAFGRLRISDAYALFDSQHRYDDNHKWSSSITGSASVTHNANSSIISLTVDNSLNTQIIRETNKVFYYQPGKSLLVMNTFVFNEPKAGLRQRVGYFNSQNGVYLEQSGTEISLVLRSFSSGSLEETRVLREDWNIDRFDGTQSSYVPAYLDVRRNGTEELDLTKAQIFWMDIEWLGVGDVRCGFVHDGALKPAHIFHHSNIKNSTYMTTACLPLRYEIKNTTATSNSSTLKQICSTVVSEGGFSPENKSSTFVGGLNIGTPFTLGEVGDFYNVATIRLKNDHLDSVVIPSRFSLLGDSNASYQWRIVKNANFSVAPTFVSTSDVATEISTGNTIVSGGTIVDSGFISTHGQVTIDGLQLESQLERYLQNNESYTRSTYTLAVSPASKNSKIYGQLKWMRVV